MAERHGLQALAEKAKEARRGTWRHCVNRCVAERADQRRARVAGSDRLAARDEADVYKAAVAWLRAQTPPLSDEEAAALLSHVRFPLLSCNFVRETVKKSRSWRQLRACVCSTLHLKRDIRRRDAACTRRRIGFEKWLYAVGGRVSGRGSFGNPTSIVERYDPATNSWEAVASMSTVQPPQCGSTGRQALRGWRL